MLPGTVTPATGGLEKALDNLALAATNDFAILQQLTAANLSLGATIATLTATNKKLVEAGRTRGTPTAGNPASGDPAAPPAVRRGPLNHIRETTVGHMVIASTAPIPVPPVLTKQRGTVMRLLQPTH